jgi:hypothetical protein
VKALVADSELGHSAIGAALVETINDGGLRMVTWVNAQSDRPVISGVVANSTSSKHSLIGFRTQQASNIPYPTEQIVSVMFGYLCAGAYQFGNTGCCDWRNSKRKWRQCCERFGAALWNQLRFSIPLDGAAEETHLVAHDHLMQIPDVLIHIQADFRESMNERPNNSVDQLIARLEKMYQHWRVQSRSPSELRSEFGTTSPTIPLTSVAEGDRSAGDYK